MTNKINTYVLFFSLLLMTLSFSCRSEDDLSIDPPVDANIAKDSNLALLMSRVALNDGSEDNIIDGASNLKIKLPVLVTVNGININITSSDGYDEVLETFDLSSDDDDLVIISYPITVIFPDFSTLVINSDSELNSIIENNDNDDDIECIDFEYPITASVFDENSETLATISINNDNELYDFIEDLDEFTAVTINFPITVVFADGSVLIINTVQELEIAIETANGTCDEDDDNDFNDCNFNTYSSIYFEDSILACGEWTIDKLNRSNTNLVDLYEEYVFEFNMDGSLLVTETNNTYNGTWEASGPEGDIDVTINVIGLPDFNDTWNLCKINLQPVEKKIDLKIGTDRLRLGSFCSNNTDATLDEILEDGTWIVSSYSDNGVDESDDYLDYELNFSNDGNVFATNGTNTNNGTWSVFANNTKLNLDFNTEDPFQELNDNGWDVISVSNTEVTVQNVSGQGNNASTDILTFQKL